MELEVLWRSSARGCSRAGLELFIAAATCCNVGLCVRGKGKKAAQRSFLAARTEAGGGGDCCWRGMTASLIGGTTMGIRMPVEHIHMHTWIHSLKHQSQLQTPRVAALTDQHHQPQMTR